MSVVSLGHYGLYRTAVFHVAVVKFTSVCICACAVVCQFVSVTLRTINTGDVKFGKKGGGGGGGGVAINHISCKYLLHVLYFQSIAG